MKRGYHPNTRRTQWKPGQTGNPNGRPPDFLGRALRKNMSPKELEDLANLVSSMNLTELKKFVKDPSRPAIHHVFANAILGAIRRKEFTTFDKILGRMIGRPRQVPETLPSIGPETPDEAKTFSDFCLKCGYPRPFPKQVEMYEFGIEGKDVRLLLGARGYGKTDYVVLLGVAYKIFKAYQVKANFSALLITKSQERNASILREIAEALLRNGVVLERNNASTVRVAGKIGKDHSISSLTIGSCSLRGRHPDLVLFDDPVTPEDTSAVTRRKVKRVYDEVVGKICGNVVLIGQPVHRDDLYQMLRPKLKQVKEVPYGSIPELDVDLDVQRLAGVSEETIQASYHLKIVSTNATPFDAVKYVDDLPAGSGIAWIDPSEGGDYTALCIGKGLFEGMAIQGFLYKKAWYHALPDMVLRMKAAGVKRLGFETNTTGDDPIEKISAMLPEGVGVSGKRTTKNKEAKIMNAGAFAPFIHLAKTSDPAFIEQVVKYETGVEYDDAPDSLASLLEWVGLIRGK